METSYPSRRMGGVAVLGGIWEIVFCRPWRSADGEIDIVAVERQVLVVCEMKSRMPVRYRSPLDVVNRAKRARLCRLAVQRLNAHCIRFDQVRIDVVGLAYE